MIKNKKIRYALTTITGIVLLVIAGVYWLQTKTQENAPEIIVSEKPIVEKKTSKPSDPLPKPSAAPVKVKYVSKADPSKLEELKHADDLNMNLVDGSLTGYIQSLYFKYRNSQNREEFMGHIKAELFAEFPAETALKLYKIYETYIDCELALQDMIGRFAPPQNEEDKIFIANEIFEFRKDKLGDELAEKLFGQEYKLNLFKIKSAKIFHNDTLYGYEKELALQEVTLDVYGNAVDGYISDKTGESLFREKLQIYKRDLDEMDEDERKTKIREFRMEYLDIEEIGKIEAAEEHVAENEKRDQDYTESKNAILNDVNIDENQKEEMIHALQDEMYGDMANKVRLGEEFSKKHNEKMKKFLTSGETMEDDGQ